VAAVGEDSKKQGMMKAIVLNYSVNVSVEDLKNRYQKRVKK